jgi:predicted DNA binding CopG/RHH family protein
MNFKELINKIDDCLENNERLVIVCPLELSMTLTSYLDEYEMKSGNLLDFHTSIKNKTMNSETPIAITINCRDNKYEYFVDLFKFKANLIVDAIIGIGEYTFSDFLHYNTRCISIVDKMVLTEDDYEFLNECKYAVEDYLEEKAYDEECEDSDDNDSDEDDDTYSDDSVCDHCTCDDCKERNSEKNNVSKDKDSDNKDNRNNSKYIMDWSSIKGKHWNVDLDRAKKALDDAIETESRKQKLDRQEHKNRFKKVMYEHMANDTTITMDDRDRLIDQWFYMYQIEKIMAEYKKNEPDLHRDKLGELLCEFAASSEARGMQAGYKAHKDYVLDCLCDDDCCEDDCKNECEFAKNYDCDCECDDDCDDDCDKGCKCDWDCGDDFECDCDWDDEE